MARQVLPIVGAVVGAYFGGPQGAQIGFTIGSLVGNAVDPLTLNGPKLGEAGLQTSAEGVFRPVVYGTAPVKGNIIERVNRIVRKQKQEQEKGGGPITVTERVYWTFAIRIAEGPIGAVLRVWMDEKLVFDIRPDSEIPQESAEFAQKFSLYLGDEDQLPDPGLEAHYGINEAPAYRGTAYVVFRNFDLTDRAERIPEFRFEVTQTGSAVIGSAMVLRNEEGQGASWLLSDNGADWPGPFTQIADGFQGRWILGMRGRYLVYTELGHPKYTEDGGATWQDSTGDTFGGSGGSRLGWYDDFTGESLIPGGLNTILRSTDNGSSWHSIPTYVPSSAVTVVGPYWISYWGGSTHRLSRSVDGGSSWSSPAPTPGFSDALGLSIATNPTYAAYIGGSNAALTEPAVMSTSDGVSVAYESLPGFASADSRCVISMCFAEDKLVIGTDGGEIAVLTDNQWTLSPIVLPGRAESICFNGRYFIIVARDVAAATSFIATTEDGISLTIRREQVGANYLSIAAEPSAEGELGLPVSLSSIVSDISDRALLEPDRYDTSQLTDLVDGVVMAGDYSCADAIGTLLPIYTADPTECDMGSGYKLNYIKRGAPVVATIDASDLVDAPEEAKRMDPLEYPRVLHMHFESPQVGYAPAKASPSRTSPDVRVVGEVSTAVPVNFSDINEAWRRADVQLKIIWTEIGGEVKFSVPDSWIKLVPTDTIGLNLRGKVSRLRVLRTTYSEGVIGLECVLDRQSAYTSNLTGIPLPEPTPPPPSIVGLTIGEVLDIPALNDNNDRLLYYVAASGQNEAWFGAQVQRSFGGGSFEQVAQFSEGTAIGVLIEDVASASPHYTDTTNVVKVQLYAEHEIDSLTTQQFLSEGGSFAIENPDGSWELLQYRDADQTSDDSYELSVLLRGRLNSGAPSHASGSRVVFLDGVKSVDAVTAFIGQSISHRYVSFGTSPDGIPAFDTDYVGRSQIEFPVAHLFATRDGSTLSLRCVPRHRFGTEDRPVQSINHAGYRWNATDGVNASSLDTVGATSAIDISGWGSPITVTVSQLNRFTGTGPTITEVIA